jgi:hypothetical protein
MRISRASGRCRLFQICAGAHLHDAPGGLSHLRAALNNVRTDGLTGGPGGVVNGELLFEMLAALFDGSGVDAQLGGRFLGGVALGRQLKQFHLARIQASVARL